MDLVNKQVIYDKIVKRYPDRDTDQYAVGYADAINDVLKDIRYEPSAEPEIIYCKDCVKHNKGHGYYYDGTVIGIKDCCPLVEIRGRAQGHEFDYQFCAYAERRTDE